MRTHVKLVMIAVAATAVLATAVGAASARRFEISNPELILSTFVEALVSSEGLPAIVCEITLEYSFHSRAILKISGSLVGHVKEAEIHHPCASNAAWVLNGRERLPGGTTAPNTLPWHLRYDSFTGRLPFITSVSFQIIGASLLVEELGVSCLYRSTAEHPLFVTFFVRTDSTVSSAELEGTIPRNGGVFCPPLGIVEAHSGHVGDTDAYKLIEIRLVF